MIGSIRRPCDGPGDSRDPQRRRPRLGARRVRALFRRRAAGRYAGRGPLRSAGRAHSRHYEAERWPVGPSDPIDLIRFAIEDMGRSQADLARILGSRSRASEILARKRGLTLDMIRTIAGEWHLPVEALARPYRLDAAPASAKARGVGAPRLRLRTASRRYRFPPAI